MIGYFRKALTLVSFLIVAGQVHAEIIPVRGGEHEAFTRLVFDLPRRLPWRLDTSSEKPLLFISTPDLNFDLSSTFIKLTDARIAGLSPQPDLGAIAFELNCKCEIEAFLLNERMLVIDIRNASSTIEAEQVNSLLTDSTGANTQNDVSSLAFPRTVEGVFPFSPQSARRELAFQFVQNTRADEKDPVSSGMEIAVDRVEHLKEAEQRLLEQISRAASQGMISPKMARIENHKTSDSSLARDETSPEAQPSLLQDAPRSLGINLRAQSSTDRDFKTLLDTIAKTGNGEACFSNQQMDIAKWASDATFGTQVGKLRAELLGEFDRADPDVAAKLVRMYLYFGFGAEGLSVLSSLAIDTKDYALLASMARIMEIGFDPLPGDLHQQLDCDTSAAFWAVLAHQNLPPNAQLNTDAVLRAVNALRPHLRQHLGPILTERLLTEGYADTAAKVVKIMERGQTSPDPRVEMSGASVNLAEGDFDAATEHLDAVVSANTELSPKALIQLIDAKLSSEQPIHLETARLAETYALEYRRQPLGIELQRVHILARAASEDFPLAFNELNDFAKKTPEAISKPVRSQAMRALTQNAKDTVFLRFSLVQAAEVRSELAADVGNKLAARLITLGFPLEADSFLKSGADGQDGRARRLLRAESALAQNLPRRAEADLLGLDGEKAQQLRALARSMIGDHQSAQEIFATLGQNERALSEAWLASDWEVLKTSADELLVNVSNLVAPEKDTPPPLTSIEKGILARDHALLQESAETRETLRQLLSHFEIDGALTQEP